ncbi:signal peptidase II [Phenylobacterium hankyongense]|jgi:signal peptidase II|uniref:Lipoprotein signal peptidase n=1 Tax=Phenylobacterium hankyongense TaxID=1813876 RepID=A0A328AY20_9CAUL|nr:signal peptidase II [Phenylobacterium hankyongense]RAK59175.1 signal peptidase II [Phenylobacterium hankyongense]
MKGVTRLGWTSFAIAAVAIVLDQAVKSWILYGLKLPEIATVPVAGPFHLTMVWNAGVSFGFLRADHDLVRWMLVAFSVIVALMLAGWARRSDRLASAVGLGLVMGGAVGNAIDRARFGAVVDFVDVSRLWFPWVFNVADSAISVGVALLLLDSLRRERPAES